MKVSVRIFALLSPLSVLSLTSSCNAIFGIEPGRLKTDAGAGGSPSDRDAGQDGSQDGSSDGAALECDGAGQNACGGCGLLSGTPGQACGDCGQYVCSPTNDAVSCVGSAATLKCSGSSRQACQPDGNWNAPTSCAAGYCYDGSHCGTLSRVEFGGISSTSVIQTFGMAVSALSRGRIAMAGSTNLAFDGQPATRAVDSYLSIFPPGLQPRVTKIWGSAGQDYPTSMAAAGGDRLIVAGYTDGALYGTAVTTGAAFVSLWDASGSGAPVFSWGVQSAGGHPLVAVDAGRGAVFVMSTLSGSPGFVLSKLSLTDGHAIWANAWTQAEVISVNSLAVNAAGDVFAVGEFDPDVSAAGPLDAGLAKFSGSAKGPPLWTRTWGTPQADSALSVITDADGNIYVAGATWGGLDAHVSAGNADAFVVLFDPQGTKSWTRQWGTSGSEVIGGLVVTPTHDLYASGHTDGTFTQAANGGYGDLFATHWTPDGSIAWTVQSATAGNDGTAPGAALALDPTSGALYVAGAVGKTNPAVYQSVLLRLAPQ